MSTSKVIVSLIETGIESQEKERFLTVAEQMLRARRERRVLMDELDRMVFGQGRPKARPVGSRREGS